jgi:hypothetical protein
MPDRGLANQIIQGTYGVVDIFIEQRKYDKDKAKFFIWKERGYAPLTSVLITHLPKVKVGDPEPRHFEVEYDRMTFNTISAGSSQSPTIVKLDDPELVKLLPVGSLLKVDGLYFNGSEYATTWSPTNPTEEVIEVLGVDFTNGTLTVRRGIGFDNLPGTIPVIRDRTITLIGNVYEDGSKAPQSVSQNPVVVSNYLQFFRQAYEITDLANRVDIFGENELQRKGRWARRRLARAIEHAFFFGRMYKRIGENGQMKYYTGGVDEFIPNDAEHRVQLNRADLSVSYLNEKFKNVFLWGSSNEKYVFCGMSFMTAIANVFVNQLRVNDELQQRFGLNFKTIEITGAGALHFIPSIELELAGRGNDAYILDINYLQYMYIEGKDIHLNTGRDGKGLQANDEEKIKYEIQGWIGLKRSFREAHYHYRIV